MNDFLSRLHDSCDYLLITVVDANIIVTHIQIHILVAEFFGQACTMMKQCGVDRTKAFQVMQRLPNPLDRSATLPQLLDVLRGAGRPVKLAIELKHPSPYQLKLEDRVLEVLRGEGWDPGSSTVDNVAVTFMSFSPDSVRHLLQSVPAQYICQLVDDLTVHEIRGGLGLGLITGGAFANLMKATQLEGERILDAGLVGLAGPGIDYVRERPDTIRQWLEAGRRFRVWTVDSPEDVALCRKLGIHEVTTNVPARVLSQLQVAPSQGR